MDISMSWLKDYVDVDCSTKEFMDKITLSGSKVEGVEVLGNISKVVVGQVKEITKHPDADKLVVTQIDVGASELLQIVTGAKNLTVGDYVPVALDGSILADGTKIKKGKLRGVSSNGMLCSVQELGCDIHDFPEADENGIYIFPESQADNLGKEVKDIMDLEDEVVEFEITSNRPDCFSVIGIARETAATLDKELKYPEINVNETAGGDVNDLVSVSIENPELCQRYVARAIKNVKIEPSPRWMRKRLRSAV